MDFLPLRRRRSSSRNVPGVEKRGERDWGGGGGGGYYLRQMSFSRKWISFSQNFEPHELQAFTLENIKKSRPIHTRGFAPMLHAHFARVSTHEGVFSSSLNLPRELAPKFLKADTH